MPRTSWSVTSLTLTLLFGRPILGQQAPTGEHYGGRAADTGFGSAFVSSVGDVRQSIPLLFPPEASGLPIPLSINYRAHHVGAAGLGWEIPFSFIERNKTLAHRRPLIDSNSGDSPPQPRERTYLNLLGTSGELIHDQSDWLLRLGSLETVVRESNGNFMAYDGLGRTYTFQQPAQLNSQGMWLLKSIMAPGGRSIQLSYEITTWPINGGQGLEINLHRIAYNTSVATRCAKNEINLTYGHGSLSPISLTLQGTVAMVRLRTLTEVNVQSRASCETPLKTLRRFVFGYGADADTQLPRLTDVRQYGREGTPAATVPLPVANFSYGSATQPVPEGRALIYASSPDLPWPTDADDGDKTWIGLTKNDSSISVPGQNKASGLWQDLIDINGDGRPDFVYKRGGKLTVQLNKATAGGLTDWGAPTFPLQDATFNSGPLSINSSTSQRFWYGTASRNTVDTWRRAVDVNGDGRIDVIDASEVPGRWNIYLNTPGGPNGVKWERRSISVLNLRAELESRGHVLPGGFVPLSRRTSGVTENGTFCLQRNSPTDAWDPSYDGNVGDPAFVHCDHGRPDTEPPPICTQIDGDTVCAPPPHGVEQTFAEWDLIDLNGDGYPDFVYNTRPVQFFVFPGSNGQYFEHNGGQQNGWFGQANSSFKLPSDTDVRAAFNIIGVHLDTDPDSTSPFAQSISLHLPETVPNGVSLWADDGSGTGRQIEIAGFADVNGDGLMDRIVAQRVHLGAYADPLRSFSSVYLTLPTLTDNRSAFMAEQISDQKAACVAHDEFTSTLTQGLRDLTGDGIPDYFDRGRVFIGTGAGFIPLGVPTEPVDQVNLSIQRESCRGDHSETYGGLFDVDGNGIPAMVTLQNDETHIRLTRLDAMGASPHAADAGRLTGIGNGFGASTQIDYVSAKEDLYSTHLVPFPEIVVTKISTTASMNLGSSLLGHRFAYGSAVMEFDSQRDAFRFPGYGRTVSVALYAGKSDQTEGTARVRDTWPMQPFSPNSVKQDRWVRESILGQWSDVYALSGSAETDPWALLHIDANDVRIIGHEHATWTAKLFELPASTENATNPRECTEMVEPYDFALSFGYSIGQNALNPCLAHGFAHLDKVESWYGVSAPPSANNIATRVEILSIDNYGQITELRNDNDANRADDDVCVQTKFAVPTSAYPRFLAAPSRRQVTDCDKHTVLASEAFVYDGLSSGSVSRGRVTSHSTDRRATDDGGLLRSINDFDATYDNSGNLSQIRTSNQGKIRNVRFNYDPFGLRPVRTSITATGIPAMSSVLEFDPISGAVITMTDSHQVTHSARYDGYGRLTEQLLKLPNAPRGVVATIGYVGFDGADPEGRRMMGTQYLDPVPIPLLSSTPGKTATTYLDELGRTRRVEIALGSDYGNDSLIVEDRVYDAAGRVGFTAEPYAKSHGTAPLFGRTIFYKTTGDVDCVVRALGQQPYVQFTDVASDRYTVCFDREFDQHSMITDVMDSATMQSNDPHDWIRRRVITSAVGQVLEKSTVRAGTRLEYAAFSHDQLGQLVSMTRFADPGAALNPVSWSRRMDSLGNTLKLSRPEASPRLYEYDDWGALTDTVWHDGGVEKRLSRLFDAFGRLSQSQELNNGVPDADTSRQYSYDSPAAVSSLFTPSHVAGRLAAAIWKGGKMGFGYDAPGHLNAKVYQDDEGGSYVSNFTYHANGSLQSLNFKLPDNAFQNESVRYGYDTAARLRLIESVDGAGVTNLYQAQDIDPWGRARKATYGADITVSADYADTGRRLLREFAVETPFGSRKMSFGGFDALGRETVRQEFMDGSPESLPMLKYYNDLGQLASVTPQASSGDSWKLIYDGLGNITTLENTTPARDAALSYRAVDRDRICRIEYSGHVGSSMCNVQYDASGSVIEEPTRTGSRQISYFSSGAVRSVVQADTHAQFAYDALGDLQKLDLQSGSSADVRRDRHFGSLLQRRDVLVGNIANAQVVRSIPGPGGLFASRRGPANDWIFDFSELRGSRFTTDYKGHFIQDLSYTPYGEATSTGAQPTSAEFTWNQWNGGDTLAALGLSHLGARLYDPVVGRFLSRDPIPNVRGGAGSNPYTFAMGDPFSKADPSGLDYCNGNYGQECQGGPTQSSGEDGLPPVMGSNHRDPGPPIAEPQVIDLSSFAYGIQVDEATGAFHTINGPSPQLTLPWSQRANDPNYWLLRASNSFSIPSDDDPYTANQKAYEFGEMQVTPACGSPINCAAAGVGWLFDPTNDDPDSGLPPFHSMLFMFSLFSGLGELDEAGSLSAVDAEEGALAGESCAGGTCGGPHVCFVGSTLVATPEGLSAIQDIRLGSRVKADNPQCAAEHLPTDAVTVEIEAPNPEQTQDIIHAKLVRSRGWLREHHFHDGKVWLDLPEFSLNGWVTVMKISAAPREESGDGCLVLTTMNHVAERVLELTLEDNEHIELTPAHPLYVEGHGWTPARELKLGQQLRSTQGPKKLQQVAPANANQRVYNIEVATEHSYRVAKSGVWAHNSCDDFLPEGQFRFREPLREPFELLNTEVLEMERVNILGRGFVNPVTDSWNEYILGERTLPQHFETLMGRAGELAVEETLPANAQVNYDRVLILTVKVP